MAVIFAPIAPGQLDNWKRWVNELNGSRRADFADFNRRHNLTRHEAWLCETPMGPAVVAIHEGPGSADLIPNVARSTAPFDVDFRAKLQAFHNMDITAPPPGPMPVKMLG